jgi:hypothetical protein
MKVLPQMTRVRLADFDWIKVFKLDTPVRKAAHVITSHMTHMYSG